MIFWNKSINIIVLFLVVVVAIGCLLYTSSAEGLSSDYDVDISRQSILVFLSLISALVRFG